LTTSATSKLQVKIFNWQVGYRQLTSTSGVSRPVTATSHVDRLVEDASTAYMAPEAISDSFSGEGVGVTGNHLDISRSERSPVTFSPANHRRPADWN